MPKLIDMTGVRVHRLTVLGLGTSTSTTPRWRCLCDCGREVQAYGADLRSGKQRSCGCWRVEQSKTAATKHGWSRTTETQIWNAMKQRCSNIEHRAFANYGGRGIEVCERWRDSFEAFLEDMGPRPSEQHSIDRIDNEKGYEPGNVRWSTDIEQASNTRKNVYVEADGKRMTVMEWARKNGVSPQTVYGRINRGQPFDQPGRPGPRSRAPSQPA